MGDHEPRRRHPRYQIQNRHDRGGLPCFAFAAYGQGSSKDLSPLALAKVREHFDKLAKAHGVPHSKGFAKARAQASPLERKAWALWGQLKRDGAIADGSAAAFRSFVKNQTKTAAGDGVDDIRFCTGAQTHQLIERLKKWQERGSNHEKIA